MISTRAFTGKLNLDTAPERLPAGDWTSALNITRDGGEGGDKIVSNVRGNRLIPYTLPEGDNQVIGVGVDEVRGRLYMAVQNSGGYHSLLYWDKAADSITKVLESKTDSGGVDILAFSTDHRILHFDVVYRDAEGDLLFWTDGLNRPSVVNVTRATTGGYGTFQRSFLDVHREMPDTPPTCAYEDDAAVTVNNLRKKLFRFRYRFVYDDGEKSCWSTHSKLPLPLDWTDSATDPDPTKNARIALSLKTGAPNVAKIEVAATESRGAVWSDFFLIRTLVKADDGIGDDTTTTLQFYNDEAYSYIDLKESLLEFDRLPHTARAQALPNGNTLVYGALEEGYDWEAVAGTATAANVAAPAYGQAFNFLSRYQPSLIYFDEKGASDGARYTEGLRVQTAPYEAGKIPQLSLSVTTRPPAWARTFQLLLTKNLSKSRWLYWVSDQTFADEEFAYVGIENLNTFREKNPDSPLSYGFAPGDRLRFVRKLSGTPGDLTDKDYEIRASVVDPTVVGQVREGQFLKIALPPTDTDFDFGSGDYFNYLVEIYTPALSVEGGLDVSYEVGEKWDILDAGTEARRHDGETPQSADLATPAAFTLTEGDGYYRERTVNTGVTLDYEVVAGEGADSDAGRVIVGTTFLEASYTDPLVTANSTTTSPLTGLVTVDFGYDATKAFIKLSDAAPYAYTFRLKGALGINFVDDYPADTLYEFYLRRDAGDVGSVVYDLDRVQLVEPFDATTAGPRSFPVDATFTLQPGEHAFIVGSSLGDLNHQRAFIATDLTVTRELPYTVGVIDQNFSDYYPSAVNAYGRPWVEDRNARRAYYPTLVRFSDEFAEGTLVNRINRFYADNQATWDRGAGDIEKLVLRGRLLYVFQRLDTGVVPVLQNIWRDLNGNPTTAESDKLLNAITYPYAGRHGIGGFAGSHAAGGVAQYFCTHRGEVCRLSQDGITVLSEVYECAEFFRERLVEGAWLSGAFHPATNKYYLAGADFCLSFLESRGPDQGFESELSFAHEALAVVGEALLSAKEGGLWVHDSDTYCHFYGTQYAASITAVFNDAVLQKKTFAALTEEASSVWAVPLLYTNVMSYGAQRQESNLVASDFEEREGSFHSDLLRDTHSVGGLLSGDTLKGKWLAVKLEKAAASAPITLNAVSVAWTDSPRNPR